MDCDVIISDIPMLSNTYYHPNKFSKQSLEDLIPERNINSLNEWKGLSVEKQDETQQSIRQYITCSSTDFCILLMA